jgi:serine/threonine protein kinase
MSTVTVKSIIDPNKSYQYIDNGSPSAAGGMKDIYFSPDKSYVVGFYRAPQDFNSIERLKKIVTTYYDRFFNNASGSYYKELYSWPTDVIKYDNRIGIIVPCYNKNFFFKKGYYLNDSLKGQDKEGKWFASPLFRVAASKSKLDNSELGSWLSYFQIGVNISRGVKRLHAAGLAHSDLSYKNVLIDPVSKTAAIIDIDGLVVPGLFAPDVIGTPDFIAPEVLATLHLNIKDPNRKLPNIQTDKHALAVLIYMYLLYRHPLKGGRFFGSDIEADEEVKLTMGTKALFIEHPSDKSNQNLKREYGDNLVKFKPWTDLSKTPYTILGPYLKELFDQAFIKGLHNPNDRPPASMWEQALIKTMDLKLQCANAKCDQQWFIYIGTNSTSCPFCNTRYDKSIPILDFYFQTSPGKWKQENQRLVIYNGTTLQSWHTNRNVITNENLTDAEKKPVGYFSFYNNKWLFVNQTLTTLVDKSENKDVKIGEMLELTPGKQLILSKDDGGRVAVISIANK